MIIPPEELTKRLEEIELNTVTKVWSRPLPTRQEGLSLIDTLRDMMAANERLRRGFRSTTG